MIRFLAFWMILVAGLILSFIIREEKLAAKGKVPVGRLRRFWLQPENRNAPRYRTDWTIRYEKVSGDPRAGGKTIDVSQTGAALVLRERLEPGVALQIELLAPENSAPMTVTGKVVWVKPLPSKTDERLFMTGIQFEALDPKTENLLLKSFSSNPRAEESRG